MQAITSAANAIGGKYLNDCELYVTLEPCVMCAGALKWSRVGKLIYGASDLKFGFTRTSYDILHPKTEVVKDVLAAESETLLKDFFSRKRI